MKNIFYLILFIIAAVLVACNSKKHNKAVDEVIEKNIVVVWDTIAVDNIVCE